MGMGVEKTKQTKKPKNQIAKKRIKKSLEKVDFGDQ